MKKSSFSPEKAYSCKRKKDFVTILGIVLFFFVVVFELYLVLWVPVELKKNTVLEKDVAKQAMINLADDLRDKLSDLKTSGRLQDGEILLAKNSLDLLALYIRSNQDLLNREQIRGLDNILKQYAELVNNWNSGKFIIKEESLDYSTCMKSLLAKAGLPQGK